MPQGFSVKNATTNDIPLLQELAHRIWYDHYPDIITVEQIDYMLDDGYSTPRITAEMENGEATWLLLMLEDKAVGFASFGPFNGDTFKLHKLYLEVGLHGIGLGSQALKEIEQLARQQGAAAIILNVNKYNQKAIDSYQRNGYQVAESVVNDIGQGFVMDDFVMRKLL